MTIPRKNSFISPSGTIAAVQSADANKTFSIDDNRHQVFTGLGASRTATLPSTGIVAGEIWRIENISASWPLVINASGGTTVTTILNRSVTLRATQATPTTSAHWQIVDFKSPMVLASNGTTSGTVMSFTDSGGVDVGLVKVGRSQGSISSPFQFAGLYPGSWTINYSLQAGSNRNTYKGSLTLLHGFEDTSIQNHVTMQGGQWVGGTVTLTAPGSNTYLQIAWASGSYSVQAIAIGVQI